MRIVEPGIASQTKDGPDGRRQILAGRFDMMGHTILEAELRLYGGRHDPRWGRHVLVTAFVRTESDSVEMLYDQGYLGSDALERLATFLTQTLGISALLGRSIMTIENQGRPIHNT